MWSFLGVSCQYLLKHFWPIYLGFLSNRLARSPSSHKVRRGCVCMGMSVTFERQMLERIFANVALIDGGVSCLGKGMNSLGGISCILYGK